MKCPEIIKEAVRYPIPYLDFTNPKTQKLYRDASLAWDKTPHGLHYKKVLSKNKGMLGPGGARAMAFQKSKEYAKIKDKVTSYK